MFKHTHPYKPFIKNDTTKLIVGTLPPPRFSTGKLLEKDVNFCYGSYYNSLWLFIDKIHASDLGMKNIKLRNIIGYLVQYPNIDTLLFTGGNSKNGPEYFFRRHLKDYSLKLELINNETPRTHQFVIPKEAHQSVSPNRIIKTVSLTSGSGSANISISRIPLYKQLKAKNPKFNTFDYRVMQYREFF